MRYAQRDGKTGAGVPGAESVVRALAGFAEAGQSALKPDVLKLVAPSRHQLVRVKLIGGVPDNAVFRAVEDAVQRQCQFHYAEVGREVTATLSYNGDDSVAGFLRYL